MTPANAAKLGQGNGMGYADQNAEVFAMKTLLILVAAFSFNMLSACSTQQASDHGQVQAKPGLERLYILNCGEGTAGDISRWSPGVNVGKSMPFVDNCYLLKHAQGWMLWDTGLTDTIATMPNGLAPAHCRRQARWSCPGTRCTSSRTGRIVVYLQAMRARSRRLHPWRKLPPSSRMRRRSSGSTTIRRSATV